MSRCRYCGTLKGMDLHLGFNLKIKLLMGAAWALSLLSPIYAKTQANIKSEAQSEKSESSKEEVLTAKPKGRMPISLPASSLAHDMFPQLRDAANSNHKFDLQKYAEKDSVWVVFQKDCDTCHRVLKESRCYAKKNKVEVIALGLYSSPLELLEDARKSGFKGPVVTSTEAIDEKFKLQVTPTTFVMRKNRWIKTFEAYVSCAEIKSALKNEHQY